MAAPKKSKIQLPATVQHFPIVGIGASAGGLDAFKRLLAAIPDSSGMAYVLVQHLDPSHESLLPEILQRATKIPVLEITGDIQLAPDHIYVIPSNKMLVSMDGVLKLTDRAKKINLTIDIFFSSLADVHKEFAVGVVLSGMGNDGTLGLKAIKEHGGISFAQDSESAAYDSMPQSAVNAGVVDFILAPEKIPDQLLRINSAYKTSHFYKDEEELPKGDEDIFKQILLLLRQRSGVDFTYYKQPTFHRRIARRIAIVKKKNLADYLKFLRDDKTEQDALFQDVLIPVTSFFRDPKTFQRLAETVFPAIFKSRKTDEPVRVWIAACSTGEEAFSMAICLHQYLTKVRGISPLGVRLQIFASDISEKAIKKARAAIYSKADVENLSEIQLKEYFIKNNGSYEVNKLIRDMCVFAPHNFLKDPPFAKMDLISCRNVLIYMDLFLQKKAFATFHYALKENGYLLLGKSETTGASSDLFTQISKNDKIYSRKPLPGRFIHVASEPAHPADTRKDGVLPTKEKIVTKVEATQTDFRKSAEEIMIAKSPASVVVNETMDIVHVHGDITPFLQAPQGKPTHNLIKMAREGLAFELRNGVHKVSKEQASVNKENIPVKTNGKQTLVDIEIIPLTDTIEPHYLIRFEKKITPIGLGEKKSLSGKIKNNESQKRSEQLEKELSQTREDMHFIAEDMEASNEELQSANEELQSSNEEMQSLNEELETSKEELQSTNEELIIVNQELLEKQEQLNTLRFYSEAIVTTLREPLVVLDKALRVKTANASFYKKFNVEEKETEDKLFYEIQNHQFDDTLLRSLLERILPQKNRIEDFEINLRFPDKGDRVILINARQIVNEKKAEQLILLAMEDITDRLRSEKILVENEVRSKKQLKLLRDLFTQAPAVLAILRGPEYVFEFANPAYIALVGGRNPTGKALLEAIPEVKGQGFVELLDNVYNTGKTFNGKEMQLMLDQGNGRHEQVFLDFTCQPLSIDEYETKGILVFATDVTDQVRGRKQMEANSLLIHNIYMNAPASICTFKGPDHVYELVNPAYQKLFDNRDLVGKRFLEALPEVKGQGVDKILDHVYNTGEVFTSTEIPVTLARADNAAPEQRYFNTTMQPIYNEQNKIIGVVNFGYDVTEQIMARKQIEASEKKQEKLATQLKLATDSAKVGIWSLDIVSSKLEWSSIHKQLWGYDEHQDLTYDDWHKAILSEERELVFRKIEEAKINHTIYEAEYRINRANDGAVVWIKSTGHYQYDEFGVAHTLTGISMDITEQKSFTKELEIKVQERTAALQITNEELNQTNRQLDQFAYIASHDLQEPLRKIITYSLLLQDKHKEGLSTEAKSYLNKIEGASIRMRTLIEDLLNYSRLLQHEKLFVHTDLNELLNNILNHFELIIQERQAQIKLDKLPSIDAIPLQMNQLFHNLISNALKFSKKDVPPVITITTRTLSKKEVEQYSALNPSTSYCEIIVKDNGIGFEQQYSDKIFVIFQRLHNRETYVGTGIGLAITKKIVENHHGEIFADANENEGASFHIILPLN